MESGSECVVLHIHQSLQGIAAELLASGPRPWSELYQGLENVPHRGSSSSRGSSCAIMTRNVTKATRIAGPEVYQEDYGACIVTSSNTVRRVALLMI